MSEQFAFDDSICPIDPIERIPKDTTLVKTAPPTAPPLIPHCTLDLPDTPPVTPSDIDAPCPQIGIAHIDFDVSGKTSILVRASSITEILSRTEEVVDGGDMPRPISYVPDPDSLDFQALFWFADNLKPRNRLKIISSPGVSNVYTLRLNVPDAYYVTATGLIVKASPAVWDNTGLFFGEMIRMTDGGIKRIEEVQIGEKVRAIVVDIDDVASAFDATVVDVFEGVPTTLSEVRFINLPSDQTGSPSQFAIGFRMTPNGLCSYDIRGQVVMPGYDCPQTVLETGTMNFVADDELPRIVVRQRPLLDPDVCGYGLIFDAFLPQSSCPQLFAQAIDNEDDLFHLHATGDSGLLARTQEAQPNNGTKRRRIDYMPTPETLPYRPGAILAGTGKKKLYKRISSGTVTGPPNSFEIFRLDPIVGDVEKFFVIHIADGDPRGILISGKHTDFPDTHGIRGYHMVKTSATTGVRIDELVGNETLFGVSYDDDTGDMTEGTITLQGVLPSLVSAFNITAIRVPPANPVMRPRLTVDVIPQGVCLQALQVGFETPEAECPEFRFTGTASIVPEGEEPQVQITAYTEDREAGDCVTVVSIAVPVIPGETGPQGEQGDTGATGAPGTPGDPGDGPPNINGTLAGDLALDGSATLNKDGGGTQLVWGPWFSAPMGLRVGASWIPQAGRYEVDRKRCS